MTQNTKPRKNQAIAREHSNTFAWKKAVRTWLTQMRLKKTICTWTKNIMEAKSMRKGLKELKKTIEKNFGKKCKNYNPFCTVCIIWHAFETIKEGLES